MSATQTATLHTTVGDIRINLFDNQAPKTVRNFVELAQGTREWTHPATHATTTDPLYDGTVFHRVIAGFMIQGGDPLGQGFGGPGYKFADEFHPDLQFDRPYLLAMANAGPNTNGSQFFVISGPDGVRLPPSYSLFGKVVAGLEVVAAIDAIGTPSGKPKEQVTIESVTIISMSATRHIEPRPEPLPSSKSSTRSGAAPNVARSSPPQ